MSSSILRSMHSSFWFYSVSVFPYTINKPENQDEDAIGKIEQQQDFVILELGASIKVGVHL